MGRRKSHRPQRRPRGPRTNAQITEDQLRVVVDGEGAQVMQRDEAIRLAQSRGLDLVEVSPGQNPPVCKIIDFGKWKYEQQKKKREQAKNQHVIHIKEIKMRPKIGDHDYVIKLERGKEFLLKGDKVKVSLRFRGREMAHPELGMKLMDRMAKDVSEIANVETRAKMEGRQIVMVLGPKKGAVRKKPESPEKPLDAAASAGDADQSKS